MSSNEPTTKSLSDPRVTSSAQILCVNISTKYQQCNSKLEKG